jgi:hypothetical protein
MYSASLRQAQHRRTAPAALLAAGLFDFKMAIHIPVRTQVESRNSIIRGYNALLRPRFISLFLWEQFAVR